MPLVADFVLAPLLDGQDVTAPPELWHRMGVQIRNAGRPGVGAMAVSAVDVALWDLKARLLDLPLVRLLPAHHDRVPVYGSGGFTNYPTGRLTEQLADWVGQGIPRVKLKTSREPERDPQRLTAVRKAVGDEPELLTDANGALSRKEALHWARRWRRQYARTTRDIPARTHPEIAGPPRARHTVDLDKLERALRKAVDGEVRFDAGSLALYVQDASNFRQVPIAVVVPRILDDVVAVHKICHRFGAPVLSRGGGTSLSGETVNEAVVMDHSKYLTGIGEVDVADLRRAARPARHVRRRRPGGLPLRTAGPPDRIGTYVRELRKIMDRHGITGAMDGHFGQGCIHCRLSFDLRTADGLATYRAFMEEAADLCVGMGGSVSGEHGDGQQRGELLEKQFGAELVRAIREFKAIWDPQGKMSPGKVVDAYRMDENLKLGTGYNPPRHPVKFAYQEDGGDFAHATLRCVGIGKCRVPQAETTMCPSYQVTHEEKHSTRGRARLLYEMLKGDVITDGWQSNKVKDALDLCLACKGCTNDCPVNVDMPT
ncbi:FAD-linked oxidase C-terminal domain-containing protein [Streptomyces albogriseolus]|uniref:FAD-linked oxidase C-terminal domain-containing protein n=1 Tax=Streptomyces albogriseolus TaxID=1887 RepID=UPI003D752C43